MMQQKAQSEFRLPKQLIVQLQEQLAMQLMLQLLLWRRAHLAEQPDPQVQQHAVCLTVWAHAVLPLLLWSQAGSMRPLLQSE